MYMYECVFPNLDSGETQVRLLGGWVPERRRQEKGVEWTDLGRCGREQAWGLTLWKKESLSASNGICMRNQVSGRGHQGLPLTLKISKQLKKDRFPPTATPNLPPENACFQLSQMMRELQRRLSPSKAGCFSSGGAPSRGNPQKNEPRNFPEPRKWISGVSIKPLGWVGKATTVHSTEEEAKCSCLFQGEVSRDYLLFPMRIRNGG